MSLGIRRSLTQITNRLTVPTRCRPLASMSLRRGSVMYRKDFLSNQRNHPKTEHWRPVSWNKNEIMESLKSNRQVTLSFEDVEKSNVLSGSLTNFGEMVAAFHSVLPSWCPNQWQLFIGKSPHVKRSRRTKGTLQLTQLKQRRRWAFATRNFLPGSYRNVCHRSVKISMFSYNCVVASHIYHNTCMYIYIDIYIYICIYICIYNYMYIYNYIYM